MSLSIRKAEFESAQQMIRNKKLEKLSLVNYIDFTKKKKSAEMSFLHSCSTLLSVGASKGCVDHTIITSSAISHL